MISNRPNNVSIASSRLKTELDTDQRQRCGQRSALIKEIKRTTLKELFFNDESVKRMTLYY